MTGRRRGTTVEDSYDSAPLPDAWSEYVSAHPDRATRMHYEVFRAGYRRGHGSGALMALTTHFHDSKEPR